METYVGEIKAFAFNKIPKNWQPCNGQVLAVSEYQKLYALIGNRFGGNGQKTFALPNLNGRVAIGINTGLDIGASGGSETVTLTNEEMPAHIHEVNASNISGTDSLNQNNDYLAVFYHTGIQFEVEAYGSYSSSNDLMALNPKTIGFEGGNQPHENRMPYQVMSYCIATDGLFPSRS
ncbi:MAG TPA: tail fiber protein [Flavipsychrobacter sp.]